MIEAGFRYFTQNKLYIWKKHTKKITNTRTQITNESKKEVLTNIGSKLDGSRLRDLAWSLDVLDLSKKPK